MSTTVSKCLSCDTAQPALLGDCLTCDSCPKPLHPFCRICGWRKGGLDSWDGSACRCGHWEPAIQRITG